MIPPHPATPAPIVPGVVISPDPMLMRYYLVIALLTGPAFPFTLLALYFQYITLRYRFDEDQDAGVWMARGILFKKEVNLTYRRVQDIHVSRNVIQRWFGLATVSVQTASANATPEMLIEGVLDADGLRDFLYQRMRGAKGLDSPSSPSTAPAESASATSPPPADEALVILREIRDSLASLQLQPARNSGNSRSSP